MVGFEIGDHHLEKNEKTEKPVLEFRFCTYPSRKCLLSQMY
jgi:hypothetical protein